MKNWIFYVVLFTYLPAPLIAKEQSLATEWKKLTQQHKNSPENIQVIATSQFFEKIEYTSDLMTWGKKDYWSTTQEYLAKEKGDCEDKTTATFFTLLQLGIPETKLKLYYATKNTAGKAHIVLAYDGTDIFNEPPHTKLLTLTTTHIINTQNNKHYPLERYNLWKDRLEREKSL